MRVSIVGPPRVATWISASIAVCHSGASCCAFGSMVMKSPAYFGVQSAPTWPWPWQDGATLLHSVVVDGSAGMPRHVEIAIARAASGSSGGFGGMIVAMAAMRR